MNGRSLPAVLWRRRWTALATVVLVALVTVAWLLLAPRRHTATSLITATPQRQLAGQSVTAHDLQATLAELARSVPVLVDARAQVGSQPSVAQPAGTQRPVAQRSVARRSVAQLQDEVHATLLRGTVLIRIAVTDADARYARDLANAIADVLPKHDPSNGLFVFANAGRATAPTDFSAPDIAVAVWVGIAAAVVLALSSALARELFAGAVDEPAQLGRLGAAPVLATLPRASGPDSDGERFRALRVALEFATSDEPTHTVVIAPVTADETPGWVAVNLAVALAQVEHRVLVVDADVRAQNRDPALRSKGPGLIDVLLGEVELRDAVRPGPVTGVSVLPAGRVRGTTAANLIELNFHKALGRIENEVDLVLIVAAPLSESDDARVMSVGNALVVTVPAGRSRVATFRDAMAELRAMRLRVVGTVLCGAAADPAVPDPRVLPDGGLTLSSPRSSGAHGVILGAKGDLMSGSTTELRDLLARLDAYVVRSAADATVPRPPTPAEAMATYEMAARLVESDLSRPGTPRDLTVHRDVLVGTHRMLKAALDAHGSEPRRLATRPALRLVGGKLTRRTD